MAYKEFVVCAKVGDCGGISTHPPAPSLKREGERIWGGWKLRGYRFNSPPGPLS